jgi:geranylgeranylglycerol-phosphate geranylgeranyltransferase
MVLLLTAGLAFAALAGTVAFLVAAAVVGLLFAYEAGLKRTGLPGNVAVAALTAATFPFGAVAVGTPWSRLPWVLAAMALFVNLAREVAKDIQDMAGDRGHRSTVPMRVGRGGAAVLATAAAAGGALVSWPFLEALVAGGEAALVAPAWTVAAADVVAVAGAAMSAAWPAAGQRLLKAAMAATLLAAAVRAGAGPPA